MPFLAIKDPENWDHLTKAIGKACNFDCSQYSKSFLQRRIEVRLRATNIDSYLTYKLLLEKSKEEQTKLDKELTIHVTNFFRDAEVFETFKAKVLPIFVQKKGGIVKKTVNIWCAGCSTGEEPITIAICFLEHIPKLQFSISGTDLDPATIEKAKAGIYEEPQFREMRPEYKEKYFEKQPNGTYKVKAEVLKNISYKPGDILQPGKPKNLDLIFCRNTVIYFDLPTKSKLYEEFFESLIPGGFFIMGKTEILQGNARDSFALFDAKDRIYQKPETAQ